MDIGGRAAIAMASSRLSTLLSIRDTSSTSARSLVIIAAITFVGGMLFVKETKDVDIYAKD